MEKIHPRRGQRRGAGILFQGHVQAWALQLPELTGHSSEGQLVLVMPENDQKRHRQSSVLTWRPTLAHSMVEQWELHCTPQHNDTQ